MLGGQRKKINLLYGFLHGQGMKAKENSKKRDDQIVKICGGLALLVVIGVFLGGIFILYSQYKYTCLYDTIQGKITDVNTGTNQIQSAKLRPAKATPHIAYTYIVEGKEYKGKRISIYESFSYSGSSANAAIKASEKFLLRYPVGSMVPVHYNPKNPSDAILETGFDFIGICMTAIGLILMIVAGFIVKAVRIKKASP